MKAHTNFGIKGCKIIDLLAATTTVTVAVTGILIFTSTAQARPVTVTADMARFSGPPAYIAIYLTDPKGRLKKTFYVGGHKTKYRKALAGWSRGVARSGGAIDGISGASVGSGSQVKFDVDVADELIKAGYQIHIDTAVEDRGAFTSDAAMKLNLTSTSGAKKGKGFVRSLSVSM